MKISFIVGSLGGGGAERVVTLLAKALSGRGDKVTILTIGASNKDYQLDAAVKHVDCANQYSIKGLSFVKRVCFIRRILRQQDDDVVISFTVGVNVYSIISHIGLKSRLIIAERNDPIYDPESRAIRLLRWLLYPLADGYVFQTKEEKDFFCKSIQRRGFIIPNPVNPDLPDPYRGYRSKRVVTVARLTRQKNLLVAIDAFKKFHVQHVDYTYEIYGEGPLRNQLNDYIQKQGLTESVKLMGASNVYTEIKDAMIFVLSSDYEGMSNATMESMALGIPTISTDYPSGGARAVINDKVNGLLVEVNNANALYEALCELADNQELFDKVSSNGTDIRQVFSIQNIILMWEDVIHS